MMSAARSSGAPSVSVRASSLVLAALATGIPLFLLLLGLSIKTVEAIRESRMAVDLIPLSPPSPPPEPPRPAPAEISTHAAAPAPVVPHPATSIDQSRTPLPAPAAPATADVSGTGTTPGTGLAGNGPGGNGTGMTGGTMPVRTEPSWIHKPANSELLPFSPQRAGAEGINGQVLLTCRVLRSGLVTDCRVASERPRNYGFGKAALKASSIFRLNPPTLNGEPDEARRVEIPVSFGNRR